MMKVLNTKVNEAEADKADPYRVGKRASDEPADVITELNDDNTSIQHLGALQRLA